jgi:hypothetical protein
MAKFPLIVENRLYEMDTLQRRAFMDEYDRRRKSVFIGYVLLILLGWHYAYVKKWGSQLLCWVTLWGLFLWWVIDWFRIPSIIGRYNKDLAVKILTEMSIIYSSTKRSTVPETETELSSWLKENPGNSINDFYRMFPIKHTLLILMFLNVTVGFSQTQSLNKEARTEILKGSEQYLFVECGHGTASIKQTVTTYVSKKTKHPYYKVKTVLWLQFRDREGYDCYGEWGYELYEDEKMAFGKKSLKQETARQSKMAFDLLKYLQIPGNI